MNSKLFQNDSITGNSLIGFEIKGHFKDDEDILLEKLKTVLNRDISFSNSNYKLFEPSDLSAVCMRNGNYHIIKTPMYSYFEAIFIMPKIMDFLKSLKSYKNSYMYIKIGFNKDFIDLSRINLLKFILEYNEGFILKSLCDITKNSSYNKLTDLKPLTLENCYDTVQKQVEGYKFIDDEVFGIDFSKLNLNHITFKYTQDINYREKWDDILKCMNHTIITLYNTTENTIFDEKEIEKIDKTNASYQEYASSFGCYELFSSKYKSVKLTVDLNNDKSVINIIFPSLKEQLFNIVVYNELKSININYDSDISKIQIRDVDLKNCFNINHLDIVNCDIEDTSIIDCDLYDCNIKNSTIKNCNLFGYASCTESNFYDCFISKNIKLKDCHVRGQLGKMGGTMSGGSLKDTTVMVDMADIKDNVEKDNVNEIN